MNGTLYGVGVGPGDPKQMTYLAIETIERCPVIAVPAEGREHAVSYKIASGIVKDMEEKEYLNLSTPMTKDPQVLAQNYEVSAARIIEQLKAGRDVAYLTLGDPTIYSTYMYIHRLVRDQGFPVQIVNGIPSFCAAAARLGVSLADRAEQLHIVPSTYVVEEALDYPGNKIFMKAGSKLSMVKQILLEKGMEGVMVENCGMPEENIYKKVEEMPDRASYYTLILVKEECHD